MKLSLKKMRLSRVPMIGMAVVGVAFLAWVLLTMAGTFDPPTGVGEKKVDPNRCPHCNFPLSSYAKEQGECLFCHGELAGSKDKARAAARGKIVPIVLSVIFGLLLVVNVAFFVRSRMGQNPDEFYYHLNCRKCTRKVRYRQRQIGQFARCPICRTLIRFPEPPDAPKGRWGRMKSWLRDLRKKKPVEDSA